MAAARRVAAGAYVTEWRYPAAVAVHPDDALESILAWCRETLAAVRRPWGIDRFDLAVAVGGAPGAPRTLSLRRLRPADLYGLELSAGPHSRDARAEQDDALERLRRFVRAHLDVGAKPAVTSIAVALFSWGDAADAALPPSR